MKNRPELWQIIFHSVLCDSKDSPPFCSFSTLKELGSIHTGRNAKWNRKFPEFSNFQSSRGGPKFSKQISGDFLFHSISNRTPEILVEWNAPYRRLTIGTYH